MGSVHTDRSQWPIVIHTNVGVMGPKETQDLIAGLDETLRKKERYYCVFDSSRMQTFQMGDRDRIVGWLKQNDALVRQYSVGTGVVLSSAALRFVISSVLLVYKPASPIKVFANMEDCLAYGRAQLDGDAKRSESTSSRPLQETRTRR